MVVWRSGPDRGESSSQEVGTTARCGCSSACSCAVTGGEGVTVTGNGSPGSEYVISMSSPESCDVVAECVCAMADAGTGVECVGAGALSALPSTDAGNVIVTGSDGRLYAGDTPEPPPPTPPPLINFVQTQSVSSSTFTTAALSLNASSGTMNYSLAAGVLTLEDAGWYRFEWLSGYSNNVDGVRFTGLTADSGATQISGDQGTGMAFFDTELSGAMTFELGANNEVELQLFQNTSGSLSVRSILTVAYLGP